MVGRNKLPAEIVIYPADRFGPEWSFTMAVPSYPKTSHLRLEGGYPEADYREALAKQGYDAAAIDQAVDAMEAGKAIPPKSSPLPSGGREAVRKGGDT